MGKGTDISKFNPNEPGSRLGTIFGLPHSVGEARVVILPVPWEVTASYGSGTIQAPTAVYNASLQVDLFDTEFPGLWREGIAMQAPSAQWKAKSSALRKKVCRYLKLLEGKMSASDKKAAQRIIDEVNRASSTLNQWVESEAQKLIVKGKVVGLLGGEHSAPYGYLKALSKKYREFGILQIDAHMDLRKAYEGFTYSHASIMNNALGISNIKKLVQVGIRDCCEEENELVAASRGRIMVFTSAALRQERFLGESWGKITDKIVRTLPEDVYISFDIDGLSPFLCPGTGTPVPGGLDFEEAIFLIKQVTDSGRKIIGFDLCEVGKSEWDGNVGARVLWKLCGYAAKSWGVV